LIRLADIVAPERYTSACPAASNLSWLAARRLRDLLNTGPFDLDVTTEQDSRARLVTRDGRSLGEMLIEEGFARPRTDAPPDWCG
jgi:endonuclease YncB( thermonuclease family)